MIVTSNCIKSTWLTFFYIVCLKGNITFSAGANDKSKSDGFSAKDEYPNATPAYDSLIANDNLAGGDNYGTSKSYVVVDTPGDIDDKDNPFHATNF